MDAYLDRLRGLAGIPDSRMILGYRLVEAAVELVQPEPDEFEVDSVPKNLRGGIIIFRTDVNALAQPGIMGRLRAFLQTRLNRLGATRKIARAIRQTDPGQKNIQGFRVGNFFRGHYVDQKTGLAYDEKRLRIELLYIDRAMLKRLAAEIARQFGQKRILVKDNRSNETYFLNRIRGAQ